MLVENRNFLTQDQMFGFWSMVSGHQFPYFFHPTTSIPTDNDYQVLGLDRPDTPFFVHTLYSNGKPNSDFYEKLIKIFYIFCEKENIEYRAILRAKVNLSLSTGHELVSAPHVDFPFDHKVFLYYFNSSDGDTVFYKEQVNSGITSVDQLTIDQTVTPEMGKGIIFDGTKYHAPSSPVNTQVRIVLNIPFV
jgi:hypothetical protein